MYSSAGGQPEGKGHEQIDRLKVCMGAGSGLHPGSPGERQATTGSQKITLPLMQITRQTRFEPASHERRPVRTKDPLPAIPAPPLLQKAPGRNGVDRGPGDLLLEHMPHDGTGAFPTINSRTRQAPLWRVDHVAFCRTETQQTICGGMEDRYPIGVSRREIGHGCPDGQYFSLRRPTGP